MASILERLSEEQSSFVLEDDPTFELLDTWLKKDGGKNVGREVTTSELCKDLCELAEESGIEFIFKGKTKSFAQRLRNLMSTLREFYEIQDETRGGRKRFLSFRPRPIKHRNHEATEEKVRADAI